MQVTWLGYLAKSGRERQVAMAAGRHFAGAHRTSDDIYQMDDWETPVADAVVVAAEALTCSSCRQEGAILPDGWLARSY